MAFRPPQSIYAEKEEVLHPENDWSIEDRTFRGIYKGGLLNRWKRVRSCIRNGRVMNVVHCSFKICRFNQGTCLKTFFPTS